MTTAKAVQTALDAAKGVDPRIEVELIDLGGLNIAGWSPKPPQDDFTAILPKLQDPALAGLIIGSPVLLPGHERAVQGVHRTLRAVARTEDAAGEQAGGRGGHGRVSQRRPGNDDRANPGGHAVLRHVPVGGNAPAFQGATVLSTKDDISADELGLDTAQEAGRARRRNGVAAGAQGA